MERWGTCWVLVVLIHPHCDGLQSVGQKSEVLYFYGAYSYYWWYLALRGGVVMVMMILSLRWDEDV